MMNLLLMIVNGKVGYNMNIFDGIDATPYPQESYENSYIFYMETLLNSVRIPTILLLDRNSIKQLSKEDKDKLVQDFINSGWRKI